MHSYISVCVLYVCMYVCMCIHIYICTYIYTYRQQCTPAYALCVWLCMSVHIRMYVFINKQINKQIYIYFMHMFDLEQILAARGCLLCVQTCVRLLKRILTSRDTETAHTGSPALLHGQPACYETALNWIAGASHALLTAWRVGSRGSHRRIPGPKNSSGQSTAENCCWKVWHFKRTLRCCAAGLDRPRRISRAS